LFKVTHPECQVIGAMNITMLMATTPTHCDLILMSEYISQSKNLEFNIHGISVTNLRLWVPINLRMESDNTQLQIIAGTSQYTKSKIEVSFLFCTSLFTMNASLSELNKRISFFKSGTHFKAIR
jgi:hypothetical protein